MIIALIEGTVLRNLCRTFSEGWIAFPASLPDSPLSFDIFIYFLWERWWNRCARFQTSCPAEERQHYIFNQNRGSALDKTLHSAHDLVGAAASQHVCLTVVLSATWSCQTQSIGCDCIVMLGLHCVTDSGLNIMYCSLLIWVVWMSEPE